MKYVKGIGLVYSDEEIVEEAKANASKIGKTYEQDRCRIEEISFGNATAFYKYGRRDFPWIKDEEDETLERKVFYYFDDAGFIYKSYIERRDGKYLASDLEVKDTVTVSVVGLIPMHNNNGDLVF